MGEIRLRGARKMEAETIYEFGKQFYRRTKYAKAGIEYDYDTVTDFIRWIIDEGVALLALDGKEIVGILLIPVTPFPMNANVLIATEWVFYTDPDRQQEGIGRKMLQQAEYMLKLMGVKLFNMVSLSNVTPGVANQLYRDEGFTLAETTFMKDIQ